MFKEIKYIIFTGAGFTANFGGFLADEMWALIFNHESVQKTERIRELMLGTTLGIFGFNYELIYEKIIYKDNYSPKEKDAIKIAVNTAYRKLDQVIRNKHNNEHSADINKVSTFIERFTKRDKKGIFFTINQDLLPERYFGLSNPGIDFKRERREPSKGLEEFETLELPSKSDIENSGKQYLDKNNLYFKLHGSQNWNTPNGMVIGTQKEELIEKVPILKWYSKLFRDSLYQKDKHLLIIGYGFRDENINIILEEAAGKYGLKIFVISPEKPSDFYNRLNVGTRSSYIWKALSGYYSSTLKDFFPKENGKPSGIYREFEERFFT